MDEWGRTAGEERHVYGRPNDVIECGCFFPRPDPPKNPTMFLSFVLRQAIHIFHMGYGIWDMYELAGAFDAVTGSVLLRTLACCVDQNRSESEESAQNEYTHIVT